MHIMGTGKNGNYKKPVKRYKKSKDPVAYARGIGVSARVICKTENMLKNVLEAHRNMMLKHIKKIKKAKFLKCWE